MSATAVKHYRNLTSIKFPKKHFLISYNAIAA
uniref:Uncharacterized protein n=1 Tax=Rhizophora mucronata TaxID=61149 RepID=A0A2P2PFG2_RHIMU